MWTILNITYKTKAKIGVHPNYAIEDDPNWLTDRDRKIWSRDHVETP